MRILVTGGNGLVGSGICEYLQSQGHNVVSLSRQPYSISENKIESYQMDIATPHFAAQAGKTIAKCDAIIHAAANKNYNHYDHDISMVNCLGIQQILQLAQTWQIKNFIYISSQQVIGKPKVLPITEESLLDPLSGYHASKIFGEHLVRISETEKTKMVILRIPSPIGINNLSMNKTIFYSFVHRALNHIDIELIGKGTRCQNYVDVRDIAHAINICLDKHISGTFNIANDHAISNLNLAKLCINVLNSKSQIKFHDKPDPDDNVVWDISINKAKNELGYSPRYSLKDSIKIVATYYENSCTQ